MAILEEMQKEMDELPQGAKRVLWEEMQEYEAKKKEAAKDPAVKDNQ